MRSLAFNILLLLIFATGGVFAQFPVDLPIDVEVEARADDLVEVYNKELSLTPKQYLLAKQALEKSLAKRVYILENYEEKEQLDLLYKALRQQHREMGNILTQIQFRRYEKLAEELQPIKMVDPEQ